MLEYGGRKSRHINIFQPPIKMPRFYLHTELAAPAELALPDHIVRHIHVLRLRTGDAFTLFNGNGCEYAAELTAIGKREAVCRIVAEHAAERESPLNITLVQAVSAAERMEFTLQKSVELGVTTIQPVISERSVVRLAGERADKRQRRWQDIVIAACEQSGRNRVPEVLPLIGLRDYLAHNTTPDALRLMMSLNRATKLTDIQPPPRTVCLMIGPEGGWSEAEETAAAAAGFRAITLGPRVLRTETASLATLAAMQTLWGDFG